MPAREKSLTSLRTLSVPKIYSGIPCVRKHRGVCVEAPRLAVFSTVPVHVPSRTAGEKVIVESQGGNVKLADVCGASVHGAKKWERISGSVAPYFKLFRWRAVRKLKTGVIKRPDTGMSLDHCEAPSSRLKHLSRRYAPIPGCAFNKGVDSG